MSYHPRVADPSPSSLEAPALLIAMPQVSDPFFHRSVVLLIHQDEEEGSFGLIVNRPTRMKVAEILNGLEIPWRGSEDATAYFGGPVQPQLGSVLFARSEGAPDAPPAVESNGGGDDLATVTEVAPGLGVSHHLGDLRALAQEPPERLRLFLGYAGWGEGQLVEEILRDDWLVAPVSPELVFAEETEGAWQRAVRSVGIDPASLPTFSAGGDGAAN